MNTSKSFKNFILTLDFKTFFSLWVILNILDVYSTFLASSVGYNEQNPFFVLNGIFYEHRFLIKFMYVIIIGIVCYVIKNCYEESKFLSKYIYIIPLLIGWSVVVGNLLSFLWGAIHA